MRQATTRLCGYDHQGNETPLTLIATDTSDDVRVIVDAATGPVPVQLDLDYIEVDRLIESLQRWKAWRGERSARPALSLLRTSPAGERGSEPRRCPLREGA
ncbi:hypothetical protein [Mycolicibacterium sp.]|jgi:hypothetical protein|uniref:hypothetical protein n=1 Tax=Mycolicibacterium sp. TaxID=2320850 RepID=UPI00355E3476